MTTRAGRHGRKPLAPALHEQDACRRSRSTGRPARRRTESDSSICSSAAASPIPHVCYHRALGPIQTCDTCLVEIDGALVRACATEIHADMEVGAGSSRADAARREAFDRILGNHQLYCTVCDNNNGDCTVHNTTKLLAVEHQKMPFRPKPYAVDSSNPFYRYDPGQCILCGRCVEACQNVQVNETLSIRWEDPHPRVLWDGGAKIGESSCVSCGHCVTVCPCNALMEKTMLGHAGFLTALPETALAGMIETVKAVEPEVGYGPILRISEAESAMRESRIRRTKTVCTYCGVGCSFDVWTKDRHILKVAPAEGPANGISTCVKGKFGWDFVNHGDRLTTPLIRDGDRFRAATWDEALDLVARRLSEVKAEHGPDALGFIASSKCTNEESYLMQKLARAVIGTNNVDNCSRYCQAPATIGPVSHGRLRRRLGLDLRHRAGRARRHRRQQHRREPPGARDPREARAQAARPEADRLRPARARDGAARRPLPASRARHRSRLAVGRQPLPLDHGLAKRAFLDQWVNGLDAYRESLAPFTLEYAARVCGIPREYARAGGAHDLPRRSASASCGRWASRSR